MNCDTCGHEEKAHAWRSCWVFDPDPEDDDYQLRCPCPGFEALVKK